MNHIIQMNDNFTACVQSVRHQHAHMISDGRATGQSQPRWLSYQNQLKIASSVLARHKCHKSLSHTRIVAQHPKFNHIQVHFDEAYTIHLMQFSLVISHCNITFPLFRHSQGSVATLIRWDGWSSHNHVCRSSLNLRVKSSLKSLHFSRSYGQK